MFVMLAIISQPVEIVGQDIPIPWRQAIVIGGLFHGVDYVVQFMLVVPAMFQLALQFGQLLFGSLQAGALLAARPDCASDMIQINPDVFEYMAAPFLAPESGIAVVVPILRKGIPSETREDD
jgi:hypothetical protein